MNRTRVFHITLGFAIASGIVAFNSSASRAATAAPSSGIHVYSCQVLSGFILPQRDEIGLVVRFENVSQTPLKSIVWRAKYGNTFIDFIDDGTFSPQARIDNYVLFEAGKRKFNWWNAVGGAFLALNGVNAPNLPLYNVPVMFGDYAGYNDPDTCAVARTISTDGALWVNPAVAAEVPFSFPSPSPKPSGSPSPDPSPTPFASGPIAVSRCSYQLIGKGYLSVNFTNTGSQAAKQIVFRVPYKAGGVEFDDQGLFSPGVHVQHRLHTNLPEALATVFYSPLPQTLDDCQVARIQYADGTAWQNPAISAAPLPTPVPDALNDLAPQRWRWQLHGFPSPIPSASPLASPTP